MIVQIIFVELLQSLSFFLLFLADHTVKLFKFLLVDAGFQVQVLSILALLQLVLAVLVWVGQRRVKLEHIDDVLHLKIYSEFLKSMTKTVNCNRAIGLAKVLEKVVYFVFLNKFVSNVVLLLVSRLCFCWLLLFPRSLFAHGSAFQPLQWHLFLLLCFVFVMAVILTFPHFFPSEWCDRCIISKDIIIIRILFIIPEIFAFSFSQLVFLSNRPQLFPQDMLADPPKLFKLFFSSRHRLSLYRSIGAIHYHFTFK